MTTMKGTDSDVGVVVLRNAAGELCVMADHAPALPEALWVLPEAGLLVLGWDGGGCTRCRDPVSRATIAQLCADGTAIVAIGSGSGPARFFEVPVHLGQGEGERIDNA